MNTRNKRIFTKIFLVILTFHNSKSTCDPPKTNNRFGIYIEKYTD